MIRPSARRVAQLTALSLAAMLCAPLRTAEAQTRRTTDAIFDYIERGRVELAVRQLELDRERLRARNERGETPLHVAARLNQAELVEAMLARGAEVDVRDERAGRTPLFLWLDEDDRKEDSIEVPGLLLAAGADMYAQGTRRGGSNTPLERLRERFRNAWFVDEEDPARGTILTAFDLPTSFWRADRDTELALVELFQSHDAIGLARNGSAERLAGLVQRVPKALAHRDALGRSPLLVAAYYGRRDAVKVLIEHGADVTAVDTSGGNLLRACAYWNHESLAEVLRKKHGLNGDIFTAVAFGSSTELGSWLDARPQDLTAKDVFGMGPLHWAVRRGATDRVQLLLARRVDPLAKDAANWTALDLAACFGDAKACALLADAGKQAGAESTYFYSALNFAAVAPDDEAFEALRAAAPKEDADLRGEALIAACRASRMDLVRRILDLSQETPSTSTLTVAAARGDAELVTLLLDRGAAIRGPDKFGRTPLYAAAERGRAHIVRLLLDRGAPVDQRAPLNGATPLRAAVDRDDPIIADMLLAAGADSHATDAQGHAPIEHSTAGDLKLVLWRWEMKKAPRP